ncbi:hypothetical protein PORY_002088 [Pneumocystis oryctolagi]|uniref:Uncharacterized protein n=1 Tax=Pneumocystis oryctolagi TaxID=42067 RepID=A0ACB7C9Z4_9ASCO|nr:hypothetical protein PORY_002088 [Pneumocystis oryctolagi]
MSRINKGKNVKRNRNTFLNNKKRIISVTDKKNKQKDVYDQTSKYFDSSKESLDNDKNGVNSLDQYSQYSSEVSEDWEDIEICQEDKGFLKDSDKDLNITLDISKCLKPKRKISGTYSLQRNIKIHIHLLHLTCLVFHGFVRNKWINDKEIQDVLRNKLEEECPLLFKQIEEYRKGTFDQQSNNCDLKSILLLILRWFRQKFEIIALGIGKKICSHVKSCLNLDDKGSLYEIISSIYEFRKIALFFKGSRDSGAQLFTSLLRSFGFNARLVFSLQPLNLNFDLEDCEKYELCESKFYDLNSKLVNFERLYNENSMNKLDNICKFEADYLVDRTRLISELSFSYPVFWTEVYDSNLGIWYSAECMVLNCVVESSDRSAFIPKGKTFSRTKMNASYILAFEVDGYVKDVTFRYVNNVSMLNRVKLPASERSRYCSFEKLVNMFKRPFLSDIDFKENNDLQPKILFKKIEDITINEYKIHPYYVLERHLKREETVHPEAFPVHVFTLKKGNKLKEERVFNRSDILLCKSVEYYYRNGRQIKLGELPLKIVKPRSTTLTRRRENELITSETNEVAIQPLYAEFQTELYIPPPVVNGIVPKNSYGNTDLFVDSMIPKGATYLPYHGIGKIAKKLGFDYSDAVIGFEFKNQRAIPIIKGILIATENCDACFEAWIFDRQKKNEKDVQKRKKEILNRWRRFFRGLRIRDHIKSLYGDYNSLSSNYIYKEEL